MNSDDWVATEGMYLRRRPTVVPKSESGDNEDESDGGKTDSFEMQSHNVEM